MSTHHESDRDIPVTGEYDVIVCGGGPTGFVAALAAARRGAKTMLLERYGFLGGTATAAMMVEFGGMHDGRQALLGGVTHEFLHRLETYGGAHFTNAAAHAMILDPESMIAVCQAMVLESGVRLLLHTWIAGAITDGHRVVGVVVENKSGRQAIRGKVVIDCTGDGDVAARAGAAFELGRPGDGKLQPVTLELLLGNVDTTRTGYDHHKVLIPRIAAARQAGTWTIPTDQLFSWGRVRKRGAPDDPRHGFFFINGTNAIDCDGTDAESLSAAEIQTRGQVDPMLDFLRAHAPGFEHCYLDRAAAQIGIRETRRITGDYTLSRDDVLSARHFGDGVVPGCNSIDVHEVSGKAFAHEYLRGGTHYQIPFRCFLPKGLDGLLVAGRCLSADHHALGSVRVMIVTMPMGDAVGTAAALAASRGLTPRQVPVADVQAALRAQGTVLEPV
jgi:glycine/D-amino acid oxidase-like deaminating enzyme